ncbi:predicted protein [Streptomyces filamentosus NRRL 15998]|uniref:Predicted protein n=1 Tax=Streptomyces filamentosus NRRL 15998 TaxID=457431 RepID=D6AL09_STRFL|nr:predicted protein [Streptomyces filamentosus NRRL 15998]
MGPWAMCAPGLHPNAPFRAQQSRYSARSSAYTNAHALNWKPVTGRARPIAFRVGRPEEKS